MTTARIPLSSSRTRRLRKITALDPITQHQQIVRISGTLEFPWDMKRALELALFRTYAVPRISGLLERTGEFTQRSQKRYDDTTLLIAEFVEHGYDSPRGSAAIARMNAAHSHYRIRNHDFLYVLSAFVLQPARWVDRYAWRPLTATERDAGFLFWREIAERMGIRDEDGALTDHRSLARWSADFEASEIRYARSNAAIGTATRDMFVRWYLPSRLQPLGEHAVYALLDDPILDAFGFPRPKPVERRAVEAALRARAVGQRRLPARRRAVLQTARRTRSYPAGYAIADLGPAEPACLD
jgi:hypothetical protein